ncbi:MAG: hypothetical protein GY856_08870 [bacterium]|nr:hypothetical protein [bacterium]
MANDFRIERWLVREDLGQIERDTEVHHLKPKTMRLLICLAENAGHVLSKEQLLTKLWEGAYVTDNALMNTVAELRKALGDDARNPRFIATIPKRGYRLIAPITGRSEPRIESTPVTEGSPATETAPRCAVLAFDSVGYYWPQERPAAILTDMLITVLAQTDSVFVASRTSIKRYQRIPPSSLLPDIARELKVDLIVEGTVMWFRHDGDGWVTARLYDKDEVNLWAKVFPLPSAHEPKKWWDLAKRIVRELPLR